MSVLLVCGHVLVGVVKAVETPVAVEFGVFPLYVLLDVLDSA
jgi:hypothetical protein